MRLWKAGNALPIGKSYVGGTPEDVGHRGIPWSILFKTITDVGLGNWKWEQREEPTVQWDHHGATEGITNVNRGARREKFGDRECP